MTLDQLRVLIVEDEPLIRMSLVDELENAGFLVLEAATGDEAVRVFEVSDPIHAIFTDIDMPGSVDGLQFARVARRSDPRVAIFVTSGYLKVAKNDLPEKAVFIQKPYDIGRLVNNLRALPVPDLSAHCFADGFQP